jgi:hypothetical protein
VRFKQNFIDYISHHLPNCINFNNELMVSQGGRKKKEELRKRDIHIKLL